MSDSALHATGSRMTEATLAIYTSITLLGVIAAASWKSLFASESELLVIIISTSITLAVAHGWASVAAHRLIGRSALSAEDRHRELRAMGVILGVGSAATLTFIVTAIVSDTLNTSVRLTLTILTLVLFVVGVVGSRRRGSGWPRAIAWGLADASIGLVIIAIKVLVGS